MTTREILNITDHRPWKLPNKNWKYYQEWNKALFLHWQVDPDELHKFVPCDLEIDYFDDKPWVSLVAFTMEQIRPRTLPAFPPISNFDEINIRTYVKYGGKQGVYFLSIEGGKSLSCKIAKSLSGLPYRYSVIRRYSNTYESENAEYNDNLKIRFLTGEEKAAKSDIYKWLTERYALFHDTANTIDEFEIHHLEWPVNEVDIEELELNYRRFDRLINSTPNKMHYSKGVKVMAWPKNSKPKSEL